MRNVLSIYWDLILLILLECTNKDLPLIALSFGNTPDEAPEKQFIGENIGEDNFDALYLPRATYYCGETDLHDLHFANGGLWAINTKFSCISSYDINYSKLDYYIENAAYQFNVLFENKIESSSITNLELESWKAFLLILLLCVGNCQTNCPDFKLTAVMSPIELLKYIKSLTITIDSFFWDLINEFSVLIFQSSLPFFREKHLNIFEKSIIKNLSL